MLSHYVSSFNFITTVIIFWFLVSKASSKESDAKESGASHVENDDDFGISRNINKEDTNVAEEFMPSNKWQHVKPGQSIPRGLHVRYNLETGYTEAKLLEEEKIKVDALSRDPETNGVTRKSHSPSSALSTTPAKQGRDQVKDENLATNTATEGESHPDVKQSLGEHSFTKQELKDVLRKFRADQDDVQDTTQRIKRSSYRSEDAIRDELSSAELGLGTEGELMARLATRWHDVSLTSQARITLLADLEYYLHHVDIAIDFMARGGGGVLLREALNSSDSEVARAGATALAAAVQSNPAAQVRCLEAGLLPHLLRLLNTGGDDVMARAVYATSALVRHFPAAQHEFLTLGGARSLVDGLVRAHSHVTKVKALSLLADLATHQNAAETEGISAVPLSSHVVSLTWCEAVPHLLSTTTDHDTNEKVVSAMLALAPLCGAAFTRPGAQLTLYDLENIYMALSVAELAENSQDEPPYFTTLLRLVTDLRTRLKAHKDEL